MEHNGIALNHSSSPASHGLLAYLRKPFALLTGLVLLISAGLLLYSQTRSFVWDEGFHLLAAQLIGRGETPYLDFCFPQTPLNAYWNAAWMNIFGEGWRITHLVAALLVSASVYLTAEFVYTRFPIARWRVPCAIVAACFLGLNTVVMQFGTIAQAYGTGLFLGLAAFHCGVLAVRPKGRAWALAAGLLAGAAAGCSLLTAPVIPVLLLWILIYDRSEKRWTKGTIFVFGTLVPFAPVFWIFAKAPRQTLFNVFEYQALFRRVNWTGATAHDVDVLSAWLDSGQALLMGFLAIAGIVYIARKSDWDRTRRSEFYLCAWLALALTVFIAIAHPTFSRYFIFMVPFASILAAPGLYFVASRLVNADRPFGPALIVAGLVALALGRALFADRDAVTWSEYEQIARKVDQVTPLGGSLYADEQVYFLTRRPPPSGMEFSYSHQLELPPASEKLLHIISQKELNAKVKAGEFETVESCSDDRIDEMKLPALFTHKVDIGDCSIFWGVKKPGAAGNRKP